MVNNNIQLIKGGCRMEVLNDMGMTDLQFKSWLKQIIRSLQKMSQQKKIQTRKSMNF